MTENQKRNYAAVAADAYINQYMGGRRVMNDPQIYYTRTDGTFGWCSTLTPLSDDEVQVTVLFEGCYGQDEPETDLAAIQAYAYDNTDWHQVQAAINSIQE